MQTRPHPKIAISLCLIAKNERRRLAAFNRNVRQFLTHHQDEIVLVDTGSTDGTPRTAQSYGWRVIERPDLCDFALAEYAQKWVPQHWEKWHEHPHMRHGVLRNFAEARQVGFDAARNRICMWLDLDDELVNGHVLRDFVDQCFGQHPRGLIFLQYHYAHDADDGYCITKLWRERIISKDDFVWKGRCHETLIPRDGQHGMFMARDPNFPCYVKHADPKAHQFSDLRNYIILKHELVNSPPQTWHDPRTMYYLGNACRGLEELDEALDWYGQFVHRSGSRDDIFAARISMAHCYDKLGRPWRAMQEVFEAQRAVPHDPRGYYMMAQMWQRVEHWKNVLTCIRLGDQLPPVDTMHAVDPVSLNFQPAALGAWAARELGLVDLALHFVKRAVDERPNLPAAQAGFQDFQAWAQAEKVAEAVQVAAAHSPNPSEALRHLAVSPHLLARGVGKPEDKVPGDGTKPTLTFWCGHSAEPWGPNPDQTGVGASEKMVMELAKRLVDRFDVSVYCFLNCPEGTYDGVHWRCGGHFNPALYRDHLVIWRMPQVLEKVPFRAGRIYVWMHDVGTNAWWTPRVLARVDRVMFLSNYQRGLHPAVPDDKVYITRNGIDLERHLYDGTPKKRKIVYMSSPERGFKTAVRLFRESGLAGDGWELHLFYGFQGTWRRHSVDGEYGYVPDEDRERRLLEFEDECKALCDGKSVILRGRLTWNDMARELKEASIWLYPTRFDEISCVAAMEAMAAGCTVVATDHAALKETLADYPAWHNVNLCDCPWSQCLRSSAEHSDWNRAELAEHARRFDLNALAQKWAEELFTDGDTAVHTAA